jgi:hypothetical protein
MSGDRVVVTYDTLAGLSGELQGLSSDLEQNGSVVKAHRGDVGHAGVADALSGFESHWKKGRDEIKKKVEALTSMLDESVAGMSETDDAVASVFTTQTAGPAARAV